MRVSVLQNPLEKEKWGGGGAGELLYRTKILIFQESLLPLSPISYAYDFKIKENFFEPGRTV